nr:calsequestrin-1-like [Nothobranchius furzeri]XP_054594695.1 calsequestrin-1-like [Nothobranchius furzeri]XP_054594697.1 calsequestrin-1-like [Nothobranchius furzeri]
MDTDVQQLVLVKEEDPEEQSAGVDQQDPEHLHIKEEQEELWTSLEGEHLCLKEETEAVGSPVTAVSIKSEDDEEKPLVSQLHQQQIEDRDVPTSSSADQMTAETGGGAGTSRNPDLNPHEQTSDSSETEVSGDDDDEDDDDDDDVNLDSELSDSGSETGDEDDDDDDDVNLDSELSDSGSETGDEDDDWNESRSSESDGKSVNKFFTSGLSRDT